MLVGLPMNGESVSRERMIRLELIFLRVMQAGAIVLPLLLVGAYLS